MSWLSQPRTLDISGDALPVWRNTSLFTVSRLMGSEKLGKLYDYTVELVTTEFPGLHVSEAQALVQIDALVGKEVTVKIAIEGSGTYVTGVTGGAGAPNLGAGIRELTAVVSKAHYLGADDRCARYRLSLRPWLWLATLTRDSRIFQDCTVVEISETILKKYPYVYELRLAGPGFGRQYPKRDYQRQFWESDWEFLSRLWQEWGITFLFEGGKLVLCDSTGAYKKHGPAYETLRYLDRAGQRIDEEHVYQFEVARALTTGKVVLTDYDYTQSLATLDTKDADHRARANDNAEEYGWGDYVQPLAGAMGLSSDKNEVRFEGEYLARVRVDAYRAKSLRAKGKGNLRGLTTGRTFHLEGFPLSPGNGEYLVVSTKIEIVNNDTVTNQGALQPQYSAETTFTAQPANTYFRTPQKAKKPRSYGEIAVVTGPEKYPVWTDRYGRVLVRFIWERRKDRTEHYTSCWLRVSSPWQGDSFGAIWIPRVGHEVEIGYQDNDPDTPFVVGRHTNEFHEPPWVLPDNHALSGWRSQSLASQSNAANSMLTDDTPGKLQVQVASDQSQSRLGLGSITLVDGHKGRSTPRGEGFELASQAHGVARANKGILITTEARTGAQAPVKDMGETVQRLTQARDLHEDLAELAQKHKAQDARSNQSDVTAAIKADNDAIRGGERTEDNPSPEMTRPDLLFASAAGLATTAAESTHQASQQDHAITAGRDVSVASGRSLFVSVRNAISFFAAQFGIRIFAAKGKVEIQAQSDEMTLAALKDVTISSTDGKVVITAPNEVWIGAAGSYIKIGASGIENCTPAQILERCASWEKQGPDSNRMPVPDLPYGGPDSVSQMLVFRSVADGKTLPQVPYKLFSQNDKSSKYSLTHSGNSTSDGSMRLMDPTSMSSMFALFGEGVWDVLTEPCIDCDLVHLAANSDDQEY